MLVTPDEVNRNSVGVVTFEPKARTFWHQHPNGQIILALSGKGYYEEKGSAKKILKKGDVAKCPANTPHWHGASPDEELCKLPLLVELAVLHSGLSRLQIRNIMWIDINY